MPRGQKSKLRAREKRRQAREDSKNMNGAEPTEEKESSSSSSSSEYKDYLHGASSVGAVLTHQDLERVISTMAATTLVSYIGSAEGVSNQDEEDPDDTEFYNEYLNKSPVEKKVTLLVNYLLYKYQVKEPITKVDIMKNVVQPYKNHFTEILKKASDHLEMLFGLDVKEVDTKYYVLINKLDLDETTVDDRRGIPVTGLLMTVLGVIFTKGNCAKEEEVWKVLNLMGVYKSKCHYVFGDTTELLTKDLVNKNYLEYQMVPNSNPPCYHFRWGPRAYAETSKMKVLEYLAKIHDCAPSALVPWYEEALKDEEERSQAKAAARAHRASMASAAHSKVMSSRSRAK